MFEAKNAQHNWASCVKNGWMETLIFAELIYKKRFREMHQELVDFISTRFVDVKSGLQGDSWIWVSDKSDKVEIDTFSAIHHQIKSPYPDSKLVHEVIRELKSHYNVTVLSEPKLEIHEED